MAFELPQTVLRKLRELYKANPLQLSSTEQHIGDRIEICSACNYCWFRRAKKKPDRCPNCHSRSWDRPLIAALVETWKVTVKTQPDQPTTTTPTTKPKTTPGGPK